MHLETPPSTYRNWVSDTRFHDTRFQDLSALQPQIYI